ncbi:MAG TPA: aldoketomutase [Firmicutes bacterium]|jgi:catechol 2,3-dioxygenase-like lactoylglutathione lyase family enzyme|nr:aldoketomutase [Bacillota bacterium]
MKFNSLIPELSVTNIEKSKEFYLNLGFKIMYERKEDKFCFLYLEDNQIMIEEINNNWNVGEMKYPFGNGINISMTVSDIDSFYESIISKKIVLFRKIKTSKYRVDDIIYEDKEFLLQDPDGYLLRFNN